jgi:hypothetical protein
VQGVLADYNMLVDKLNTDTERAEVEMECVEVKAANEQTSQVSIITNEDLNSCGTRTNEHTSQVSIITNKDLDR